MRKTWIGLSLGLCSLILIAGFHSIKAQGVGGRPNSWADCERFAGVVTPTNFKPTSGNFDELYNTGGRGGFKNGVDLLSESKPGDSDYNGGRWHVNVLKGSVSASKYANACRVEDLDPNDFDSTNNYFECLLLPKRSNN